MLNIIKYLLILDNRTQELTKIKVTETSHKPKTI